VIIGRHKTEESAEISNQIKQGGKPVQIPKNIFDEKFYALKTLKKESLVKDKQIQALKRERSNLQALKTC
jgi:hypothetical protein